MDRFIGFANAWNDRTLHFFRNRWFHRNELERSNERINAGKSRNSRNAKLKDNANINDEVSEKANEQDNDHFNDQNNNVDEAVTNAVMTTEEVVAYEPNEDGKPSSNDTAQPFTGTGGI